jgi:hypothetical protein
LDVQTRLWNLFYFVVLCVRYGVWYRKKE